MFFAFTFAITVYGYTLLYLELNSDIHCMYSKFKFLEMKNDIPRKFHKWMNKHEFTF